MSTLKEEREAIARDIHFKYLAKAKTAKIDGSELTVLPYGYLSRAVEEALLSHEEKVMEKVKEEKPHITTELRTPQGGYIGSIQVISDVGFGRIQEPEMVINKMIESAIYSMVNVLMQKGASAITHNR